MTRGSTHPDDGRTCPVRGCTAARASSRPTDSRSNPFPESIRTSPGDHETLTMDLNGSLALQEPDGIHPVLLGRNAQTQVDVVGHRMTFQQFNVPLTARLSKHHPIPLGGASSQTTTNRPPSPVIMALSTSVTSQVSKVSPGSSTVQDSHCEETTTPPQPNHFGVSYPPKQRRRFASLSPDPAGA